MIRRKKAKKLARKYAAEIHDYLSSDAKIEDYCVFDSTPSGVGRIYLFDKSDGTPYILIVEKEDLHLACIEFLKMNGATIFTNNSELEKYQEKLVSKYREENQVSGDSNGIDI